MKKMFLLLIFVMAHNVFAGSDYSKLNELIQNHRLTYDGRSSEPSYFGYNCKLRDADALSRSQQAIRNKYPPRDGGPELPSNWRNEDPLYVAKTYLYTRENDRAIAGFECGCTLANICSIHGINIKNLENDEIRLLISEASKQAQIALMKDIKSGLEDELDRRAKIIEKEKQKVKDFEERERVEKAKHAKADAERKDYLEKDLDTLLDRMLRSKELAESNINVRRIEPLLDKSLSRERADWILEHTVACLSMVVVRAYESTISAVKQDVSDSSNFYLPSLDDMIDQLNYSKQFVDDFEKDHKNMYRAIQYVIEHEALIKFPMCYPGHNCTLENFNPRSFDRLVHYCISNRFIADMDE